MLYERLNFFPPLGKFPFYMNLCATFMLHIPEVLCLNDTYRTLLGEI